MPAYFDVDDGAGGGRGTGAVFFARRINPPLQVPMLEKTSRVFGRFFEPPVSTWIIVDLAVF